MQTATDQTKKAAKSKSSVLEPKSSKVNKQVAKSPLQESLTKTKKGKTEKVSKEKEEKNQVPAEILEELNVLFTDYQKLSRSATSGILEEGKILYEANNLVERSVENKAARSDILRQAWDGVFDRNTLGESTYPSPSRVSELAGIYSAWIVNAGLKVDGVYKHSSYADANKKEQPMTLDMLVRERLYVAKDYVDGDNAPQIMSFLIQFPQKTVNALFSGVRQLEKLGKLSRTAAISMVETTITKWQNALPTKLAKDIETWTESTRGKVTAAKGTPSTFRVSMSATTNEFYSSFKKLLSSYAVDGHEVTDSETIDVLVNIASNFADVESVARSILPQKAEEDTTTATAKTENDGLVLD